MSFIIYQLERDKVMIRSNSYFTMEGATEIEDAKFPEDKAKDVLDTGTDMDGIFTFTHNQPVDLDSKLLALIKSGRPKKEIDAMIGQMKAKWDYSGSYSKILVNQAIRLTTLGFYGPYEDKEANYNVHVQVFRPRKAKYVLPESHSRPIGEIVVKVSAKRQEIFYTEFPQPVLIEPGIWHLIDFKLDGPPTLRSLATVSTSQVSSGDTNINIEFGSGSKQMPYMRFKIV